MRKKRTWIAILLSVLLVLPLLQGCRQKTPEEWLAEAQANMANLESVHTDLAVQLDMGAMGKSMCLEVQMAADAVLEPTVARMEMSVKMGGMSAKMPLYFEQKDGSVMAYMGMDTGIEKIWYRQRVETAPFNYDLMSDASLIEFQFIEEEEEEIWSGSPLVFHDGQGEEKLLRYRGLIDAKLLKGMISFSGNGGLIGGESEEIEDVFEQIGSLEMIITVDPASGYIVRMEMDMGPMMRMAMQQDIESSGITEEDWETGKAWARMPIVIEYSRFNEIETIEIPEEALEGTLIEEEQSGISA